MANYKLIFCVFLTLAIVARAENSGEEEAEASDVVILTDENFAQENGAFETSLVMFHAPWCGHCKRLAPEYAKAATILKDVENPVTLVKMDCTEGGKETCKSFGIRGYPTLKVFKNGEVFKDYAGPRQSQGIVDHLKDLLTAPEEVPDKEL